MADTVVIGAGVIGLAIGLELAHSGRAVTIYCDPQQDKYMASLAAGAMLGAFGEVTADSLVKTGEQELEFRYEAAQLYESWLETTVKTDPKQLIKRGTVLVANSFGRNDVVNLEAIEHSLQRYEEPFEVLSAREIPQYQPSRGFECHRALFVPNEGYLNTHELLPLLKERFLSFENCELIPKRINSVEIDGNGELRGIQLESGEHIESQLVVVAAGVGTSKVLQNCKLTKSLPQLIAGKGVGIELETETSFPHAIRTPNRDFACGVHLVPRGEGRVYIGATNRTASVPGTDPGVSVEEVHDILHESVHEINTGLESANIVSLYSGSRPLSTDSQALMGQTEIPGLFLATGTYRNGILMAPLIARNILKEIDGAPDPRWDFMRPTTKDRTKPQQSKEDLFREGAQGIVSFLPQPHGKLPYNRAKELEDTLECLLQLSLYNEDELSQEMRALREELKVLIKERPIIETFAQLFYRFHEFKSNEQ